MRTTVTDPLVGQLLDNRYHVVSRLASGGMATVYTARDTRLDRTVALKVMHENLVTDDTFVSRFIREAKSVARLSHPNVVAVYDQGEDNGKVFLAMEHVPGRTLRDVLRERIRLHPREALEVLERVLSALAAAHQAGFVHRDVKPENVLVSDEGRIKVADFGLARAVTSSSHPGTAGIIIGTVAYIAPEQVTHGTADARSDVYSAGILLYELLVGDVPFTAQTPLAVAYRHVHHDVPPPSEISADVPPEVDELVARATSRDPEQRPADAAELLVDVAACRRTLPRSDGSIDQTFEAPIEGGQTLVIGRPVQPADDDAEPAEGAELLPFAAPSGDDDTPAPPPLSPDERKKRRRRGVLAFVVVLLLAIGAGVGGWWYGLGRYTHVPELVGKESAKAVDMAAAEDLEMKKTLAYDEDVPKGDVVSTKPGAGERMLRGSTVTMVVSRGPERHEVPHVTGMQEDDAKKALADGNLAVGEITYQYSQKVPKGEVISSSPTAGKELKRDAKVNLVVSKGIPPVQVPSVTGMSKDDAVKALEGAHLKAAVTEKEDKSVPKGDVISQSPDAGSNKQRGTTVAIVVSKGPPMVEVPEVTRLKANEAKKQLEDAGFTVQIQRFPGGGGMVIKQTPAGKSKAKYGSTVNLVVW